MPARSSTSEYQPAPPNTRLAGYKGSVPRRCAVKVGNSPHSVKVNASTALPGRDPSASVKVS